LKVENGYYVVNKVLLENSIRINRIIIPRFFFYTVLGFIILLIGIIFLDPAVITYTAYCFIIGTIILFLIVFCAETARIWLKGSL